MKNALIGKTLFGVCYLLLTLLPSSCTFQDHRPACCPEQKQAVVDTTDRVKKAKDAAGKQKAVIERVRQKVADAKKRLDDAQVALKKCREEKPNSDCLNQKAEQLSAKASLDTAKKELEAERDRRRMLQEEVKAAEDDLKKANENLAECKRVNNCT